MKKLILASLLLGTSLCTSTGFAEACHFTITLNSVWKSFPLWTIIITDVTGDTIYEAVGGPQLVYDGKTTKTENVKLYATVNDCSNKTQLGFFGHAGLTGFSTNIAPSQTSDLNVTSSSDSGFQVMGGAANVLTGISKCVGDLTKTDAEDGVNIEVNLGNPNLPGDFFFGGSGSSGANKWSKTELGAVCNNPGGPL
jgi:hypothetical protein